MANMTSHERFTRMLEHREADRVVMWDFPWADAQARWYNEGMPRNTDYTEYFDLDRVSRIVVDNSPRLPETIVEETDDFRVVTTKWGGTEKNFKDVMSTPDFLDFSVTEQADWEKVKPLFTPDADRVPWAHLQKNYDAWRAGGHWIIADTDFGFEHFMSYVVGTERFLVATLEEPEWCVDMMSTALELNLKLLDMAWEKGYTFDMLNVRDDLGYSHSQFMSSDTFREMLLPIHKRAVDWAHGKGAWARLHTCGAVKPFLSDIVDGIGYDMLHPLERKAGMDPIAVKKEFGDRITIHGGIKAALWKDWDVVKAEMDAIVPVCMEGGGYVFAADHSIPNDVSFDAVSKVIAYAKEIGRY